MISYPSLLVHSVQVFEQKEKQSQKNKVKKKNLGQSLQRESLCSQKYVSLNKKVKISSVRRAAWDAVGPQHCRRQTKAARPALLAAPPQPAPASARPRAARSAAGGGGQSRAGRRPR